MRSQSSKGSMLMQLLQYIFFSVVCFWLLYLMRHSMYMNKDYTVENNCEEEVLIRKLLGRKADAGSSCNGKESGLNELGLIGSDQQNSKLGASIDTESHEDMLNQTSLESAAQGESESKAESEENKFDTIQGEGVVVDGGGKKGSLILKGGETVKMVQFTDKKVISVHGSSPSRRSDIQVEICPKGSILSRVGNQSKVMRMVKLRRKGSRREILFTTTVRSSV